MHLLCLFDSRQLLRVGKYVYKNIYFNGKWNSFMLARIISKKGRNNVWLSSALALRSPENRNWGLSWDWCLATFTWSQKTLDILPAKIYWYPFRDNEGKGKEMLNKGRAIVSLLYDLIWLDKYHIIIHVSNYVLNTPAPLISPSNSMPILA